MQPVAGLNAKGAHDLSGSFPARCETTRDNSWPVNSSVLLLVDALDSPK
jgi:hypothetical protein